jgi:iron complex outermembrane receptor protein
MARGIFPGAFALLIVALMGPGVPLFAAEAAPDFTAQSLEELMQVKIPMVVAASKHEQKTTEAPSSVSVVTREDIEQFGYRTLADILRSVRGIYISSDEVYSYIGIRGVKRPGDYGGRVLVMVDGHRMNEPIYDQAFNGHELPLDVDLIERVEVIRGPGSSLYGNNAALGVINIVTREAKSWNGIEASASGGSFDTFTGRLTYGREFTNGMKLILSGSIVESEGRDRIYYPEFSGVNGGISEGLDGERAKKFFGSLAWGDLTLEASYGDRRRDIPNAAYETLFNTAPNYADDERAFVEARYRHEFEHAWLVTARVYFDHYEFDARAPYEPGLPSDPPVINADHACTRLVGAELQGVKTFNDTHRLTLGGEWNHQIEIHQHNHDISPYTLYSDLNTSGDNLGLYAQDEFAFTRTLTLNAGVRYDWYSTFGNTVNPRLALIYHPWEQTTFKALYGQAFRAPNAYEFDYVAPGYAANHNLTPERTRSGELVWEQGIARNYRFTASAFYNELGDLIAQQQDSLSGDLYFANAGSATACGAEAEIEGAWQNGWRARASYSFVETRDEATDMRLSNSPQHLGKFNLVAPLYAGKLFAGFEAQAMSERQSITGARIPGHVICNFTLLSRELVRNLELSASVYNLFDADYPDPVSQDFTPLESVRSAGRTFRVKLTCRF